MQKTLTVLLAATLALSACSSWRSSRANPSNWFGNSTAASVETVNAAEVNPLIPAGGGRGLFDGPDPVDNSVPITEITELQIDPTPFGAIVYASGVAFRQGAYDAELRRIRSDENTANGVLEFAFRVVYPEGPTPQGNARSRTVSEAINVSVQDLESIRTIRVTGQQNAREARRR